MLWGNCFKRSSKRVQLVAIDFCLGNLLGRLRVEKKEVSSINLDFLVWIVETFWGSLKQLLSISLIFKKKAQLWLLALSLLS